MLSGTDVGMALPVSGSEIRVCYARSSTDAAYGGTGTGTDSAYGVTRCPGPLCDVDRSAMSGTDIGCAGARRKDSR